MADIIFKTTKGQQDYLGHLLMLIQLVIMTIAPLFPLTAVIAELEPFFFVFELIFPSIYEK